MPHITEAILTTEPAEAAVTNYMLGQTQNVHDLHAPHTANWC